MSLNGVETVFRHSDIIHYSDVIEVHGCLIIFKNVFMTLWNYNTNV